MRERGRFGRHLRTLRESRGLTQHRLALKCGIDRSYIGRLERGEKGIALSSIVKLAQGLEVPAADLLVWIDGDPSAERARGRLRILQERFAALLADADPQAELSLSVQDLRELERLNREALDHLDRALEPTAFADEEAGTD